MNAPAPRAARPHLARLVACCALVLASAALPAAAQWKVPPPAADTDAAFAVLQGRWVRPDGGYTITIRSVDASGRLDATYANPGLLPFSRAEARRDGGTLMVFLELRAGGYNGSTYTLAYDAAADVLRGTYFQAVAQQRYSVTFSRVR